MKTIYYIFRTAALLLIVAFLSDSCVHEENRKISTPGDLVEFTAQIGSSSKSRASTSTVITTRVTGDSFDYGDQVGVYMLTENGSLPDNIVGENDNRRYSIARNDAGTGFKLIPSMPEHNMFYPDDGSTVSFVAYYPYSTTIQDYVYPVNIAEQGEQSLDLLYSTGTKGSNTTPAGTLTFAHKLSKLVINLKQDVGMNDDLSSIYATLGGMPARASFSLADGLLTVNPDSDDTPIVIAKNTMNNAVAVFNAIVLPHEGSDHNGRTITFSTGSVDYTWTMPDNIDFESNKMYTCSFTLRGINLAFNGVTITDWEDSDSGLVFPVARIPAGTFWMGASDGQTEITYSGRTFTPTEDELRNSDGREVPLHEVRISKDFYLSKYEVTNAQYCAFLNALAAANDPDYSVETDGAVTRAYYMVDGVKQIYARNVNATSYRGITYNDDDKLWLPNVRDGLDYSDYPMMFVTWFGARAFCEWVNGRLPTEAEYEYAIYGGNYFIGDDPIFGLGGSKDTHWNYAWSGFNNAAAGETIDGYPAGTKPVGKKLPNGYGLYDIAGNVWEWCHDWYYIDYYKDLAGSIAVDPTGPNEPVEGLQHHHARGGCFSSTMFTSRLNYRNGVKEDGVYDYLGFRVAFSIE
ncbi:hypothetical protein D0T50_09450 [Bacteroides sp. 214]|uniref:fimbrillin family protein n=1 Tax=Bacteroides sp. 214 TaxID=2302935 RepID=UPI0013D2AB31|nr:fimbrillin family protein [Bacteroides sp. 214]NDW13117.1 hypothetical protein [Bacteroides sp. 214]